MKPRELANIGLPRGDVVKLAVRLCAEAARAGLDKHEIRRRVRAVAENPHEHTEDEHFGEIAATLLEPVQTRERFTPRDHPAPWKQWGDDLDSQSIQQMQRASELSIAVAGALMPDAHVGYGLPIGGVLATDNAVIPHAVGVDIACRMKMTVLDLPPKLLESEQERLKRAIEKETRFGMGAKFTGKRREHDVMDRDWSVSKMTLRNKDKAWSQLGTSGSGNHFVEFGTFTLEKTDLGLEPGMYLALLTHSGSRGTGANVAGYYSRLAMSLHPELPRELRHLAWLDLDSQEGREYWDAMNLMGEYAAANHALIHHHIARHLGAQVLADVENHHNFAWKETHQFPASRDVTARSVPETREVIVHRKGATPAGKGVLGIIPGSMADPGFVVRGKGSEDSLRSASHGAGRVMSRTQAKNTLTRSQMHKCLAERGVTLLSAGLDEAPFVYKNIHEVMAQQTDLVEVVGRFDPKLVKMAPEGERAED